MINLDNCMIELSKDEFKDIEDLLEEFTDNYSYGYGIVIINCKNKYDELGKIILSNPLRLITIEDFLEYCDEKKKES